MNRINFIHKYIIALLLLCGCTINVSQPNSAANPAQQPETGNSSSANTKIPVTWSSLNLSGKLVYISSKFGSSTKRLALKMSIVTLDLTTGDLTTIFEAPEGAWIGYVSISPDHQYLVMAYSLPIDIATSTATASFGRQALYITPLDGSKPPQLLLAPQTDQDEYTQPEWSPDGKYIYFTHSNYQTPATNEVMRLAYQSGTPEHLVDHAYWPRISADGTKLIYVSFNSASGPNQLFIANADGTNKLLIPLTSVAWANSIIDSPMLLPDGQTVLFSGPTFQQSSALEPNWVEKLLGITIASAHAAIPSDWWSIPLSGGLPTQLTHIQSLSLFASLSPDMKHIASFSVDGIFIMSPNGNDLTKVVRYTGGTPGTVNWIP